MKKRLCSLLLAVLMLLSILPTGVMATDNSLTAPVLQMHVRVWNDGIESVDIVTDSWQRPLYDRWDAKFFMVYPDGTTKQVDPTSEHMGRSSHIDVIEVDDAGWAEHRASQIGDGIIVYTENGTDYTIDVKVEYPNLVLYNAMPFSANSIVETLMLSEDQNVFYIALSPEKQSEGLYMTAVHNTFEDITDPSVTDIFTVERSADGKYAKLTAKNLTADGHYHFEAEVTNGLENGYHGTWGRSVRVENDMPGLYFCYGDRDDATESWFINYDQIDSEWYTTPGYNKVGSFYFGKKSEIQAGKSEPIPLGKLAFVGDDLEAAELKDNYQPTENLLIVDTVGFDAEYIRYTKDGIHYDMPVRAELPNIGFYSSNTADEDTFIYRQNPYIVTETNNQIYLAAADADRYRPVSIEKWDSEIKDLFNVATDGSALKLTVKEGETVPSGNFEVRVNCERYNGGSWHTETRYVTLSLENGMPGLYYCDVRWNEATESYYIDYNDVRSDWNTIPGNTKWVVFYYGLPAQIKAGTGTPLTQNDLTFHNGQEVEAWDGDREEQMPENALRVRCTGFNTEGISYTVDGVTYTIEADPGLPEIGFYTTDTATEHGFLFYTNPYTVTEDDRTFYICPEDPDEIKILSVGGWDNGGEDLFDTELAQDGSYVKITVKNGIIVPNDSFELEVTYQNHRGTQSDGIRIWLENGQPALMFRSLDWNDNAKEWYEPEDRPLETALYVSIGDSFPVQFYYGTADRKTRVDLDKLTFPKGIVSGHEEEGVVRLEVSGFNERGVITYINEDGETASMQVRAEQPDFAFYSSTKASKETWINTNEVMIGGTDYPYVYIVAEPGRTITGVEYIRNDETKADATHQFVSTEADDGSYVALSLNPNDPPAGNTHYEIRVNDKNGWWNSWFRLNRGDLTQLTTPTGLVWHKEYQQWYDDHNNQMVLNKKDRMGAMSFEVKPEYDANGDLLCQNHFEIEIYSAADGYTNPIVNGSWGNDPRYELTHFGGSDFIYADLPTGTYKFRARSMGDGTKYRSSEWSAMSAPFTYIRPTQRLEAPDADTFGWKKGEETYSSTWDAPTSVDAGYFEIKWSCEDPKEGRRENYGTFDMRFDAHEDNYPHYEDRIHDRMLSDYGTNDIRFRVRTIPTDITKYRISKWSGYSPALDLDLITDTVNDKLDQLLPNTSGTQTKPTVEDVQTALQSDTADLRTAMAADLSVSGGTNSGTLDRIAELEKTAANAVKQVIDAKNSAPQAIQDIASGVTMIGATLNLADKNPESGNTPTVTLELDVPKTNIIEEQKHNAVQFSMKLNGAIDKDDKEQAGQQLIVPVVIDMPVPEDINPDFLVILHRMWDGSIEQMWPHIYEKRPNVWHARFVVDSFSDFAMLEYKFSFDVETVEKMVGDEDFTLTAAGAAEGATVTYESSDSRIAEVNRKTGVVEIHKAGTVTITATAEETDIYPEKTASYTLIISAKEGGEDDEEEPEEISTEPEYSIEGITLYDADGKKLNAIPTGSFKVEVEVEKLLDTDEDAHLLLAAYTADGQYLGMYPADVEDLDREDSDTLTLEIDNPDGNIGELRTYVIRNMIPVSKMSLWDPAPADLSIDDEEIINGGTYLNVTIEQSVKNGEVKLQNAHIKGNLIIRGGGSNSIIVDGCTIEGKIIMEKAGGEAPRLYLIDSPAENIIVNTPSIIETADAEAVIGTITTKADLTLQGEKTSAEQILIVTDEDAVEAVSVTIASGTVETVKVEGEGAVEIIVNSTVQEIIGNADNIMISTDLPEPPTVKVNGEELEHIHQFDEGVITDGVKVRTCTGCGKTKTEKEEVEEPDEPEMKGYVLVTDSDISNGKATVRVFWLDGTGYATLPLETRNSKDTDSNPITQYKAPDGNWVTITGDSVGFITGGFYGYAFTEDGDELILFDFGLTDKKTAAAMGDFSVIEADGTEELTFSGAVDIDLYMDHETKLYLVREDGMTELTGYTNFKLSQTGKDVLVVYEDNEDADYKTVREIYIIGGELLPSTHYAYYNGEAIVEGADADYLPIYADGTRYELPLDDGLEFNSLPDNGIYKVSVVDRPDTTIVGLELYSAADKAVTVTRFKEGYYFETADAEINLAAGVNIHDLTTQDVATTTLTKGDSVMYVLDANGDAEQIWILAHNAVVEPPVDPVYSMSVDLRDSTATITVEGDLSNVDSVQIHVWDDNMALSYACDATYISSNGNIHTYTFTNTAYAGSTFVFKLMVDGTASVTKDVYLPMAKEEEPEVDLSTALLPTDIHLEYTDAYGLSMTMTPPADTTLISGNMIATYDINNHVHRFQRPLQPTLGTTSFMTDYSKLQIGNNIVSISFATTPTDAASAQGYLSGSTTFTANITYAEEAPTYDTSNIKATFTDAETVGKKTLTVTGLKPNQSYAVTVWDINNVVNQKREFTTDASGTGTSTWNTDKVFTQCTIAEWDVKNVTNTSANVTRRDYAGAFGFTSNGPETGKMWITAYPATMNLYWDAKPGYTGNYYVNGSNIGTYTQKYILSDVTDLPGAGTLSYKIEVDSGTGEKMIWVPETEMITVSLDSSAPSVTITGQDNGSYKLTSNNGFTGRYLWTMLSPKGDLLASNSVAAGGTINVAPYEGCTFTVAETSWTTGTELNHVIVTKSASVPITTFSTYDFSKLVSHVTDEASFSAAMNKGGKVILDNDINISNTKICAGGNVELDLNGYTLELTSTNSLTIYDGKSVSIVDNGAEKGALLGSAGINVSDGAMLTATGCTIQRIYSSNLCRSIVLNNVICNKADFNGTENVTLTDCTVGTTVGTVPANSVSGLSGQNCDTFTISGGAVTGVFQFYGCPDVTVSDCTLTVSSPCFDHYSSSGKVTHAALNNVSCTFESSGIRITNSSSLSVNGGTYTQQYTSGRLFYVGTSNMGTVTIIGGTFNMDPSAYVNAETHTVTQEDGLWVVSSIE